MVESLLPPKRATRSHHHKQPGKRSALDAPIALPATLNDNQVLTFKQWIALNNISTRTGRRILAAPGGPIVTRLSARRFGITVAHNRAWQQSREAAS
jgi:hypothetical protein